MDEVIRIFDRDSIQFQNLSEISNQITRNTGIQTLVRDVLFDAGQNWSWTTILAVDPKSGYQIQILSPATQQRVITAGQDNLPGIAQELTRHVRQVFHV